MLVTETKVLVMEKRKIPKLNSVSYTILKILEGREWVEFNEILKKVGMSPRTVRYRLNGLCDMNKIEKIPNVYDLRSFVYRVK